LRGSFIMARAGRRLALNPFVGERPLVVFTLIERPYSAAAVAALISVLWIYPDRPRLIGDMAIIVGLVPLLRIAQPLLGAQATPVLYGIASLIAVDRVRAEFAGFSDRRSAHPDAGNAGGDGGTGVPARLRQPAPTTGQGRDHCAVSPGSGDRGARHDDVCSIVCRMLHSARCV
jgi:hypothetical protein